MHESDNLIAMWVDNNWEVVGKAKGNVERNNFLILSHFGRYDWSGFRTLDGCVKHSFFGVDRENGFYLIVERF